MLLLPQFEIIREYKIRLSPVVGEISPRHVSSHPHSHPTLTSPLQCTGYSASSHFSLLHVSFSFPNLIIPTSTWTNRNAPRHSRPTPLARRQRTASLPLARRQRTASLPRAYRPRAPANAGESGALAPAPARRDCYRLLSPSRLPLASLSPGLGR
jgi:hypothetical protein